MSVHTPETPPLNRCVNGVVYECVSMLLCCQSVVALKAVHPVQLVLFVREASEPHGGLRGAAALAGLGDGIPHASVGQPAGVAAVVPQQLPGGVHLPHLGDLSAVLLAGPDCFIVGQLEGLDQVVESPWKRHLGDTRARTRFSEV